MQLVITVPDNASADAIAKALRKQATALDGAAPQVEAEETEEEEEDELPVKKTSGKKAGSKKRAMPDDEDEEPEEDESEEEEEDELPVKKTAGKSKKITIDMVNKACKAAVAESSLKEVRALLKKKFKTDSVQELEPAQYGAVIKLMESVG